VERAAPRSHDERVAARVAHMLLSGADMRLPIPALLLSLMIASPTVHAAKPAAPIVATQATLLELEIAEIGKDGARRATTLTLTLPDRHDRGGHASAELKTRVQQPGERGEVSYYKAKIHLEDTPAGTRYDIELLRAGDAQFSHADLRLEVGRVLKPGTPVQIGRVARPDGTAMVVSATLR
jgi:hypothetical protein